VAVEALPSLAGSLAELVARLGLAQVDVRGVALTDEPGSTVTLAIPHGAVHGGLGTLRGVAEAQESLVVAAATLDAVAPAGAIDLVKIDVEGWEEPVLRSGPELLGSGRVGWYLLEASPGFGSLDGLATLLGGLDGYSIFAIGEQGRLRRRPTFERLGPDDVRALRHQTNLLIGRDDCVASVGPGLGVV